MIDIVFHFLDLMLRKFCLANQQKLFYRRLMKSVYHVLQNGDDDDYHRSIWADTNDQCWSSNKMVTTQIMKIINLRRETTLRD